MKRLRGRYGDDLSSGANVKVGKEDPGRECKRQNWNGKLGLGSVLFSSRSSSIGLTYSGAVNCVQVEIIWLLIEFRDSHRLTARARWNSME